MQPIVDSNDPHALEKLPILRKRPLYLKMDEVMLSILMLENLSSSPSDYSCNIRLLSERSCNAVEQASISPKENRVDSEMNQVDAMLQMGCSIPKIPSRTLSGKGGELDQSSERIRNATLRSMRVSTPSLSQGICTSRCVYRINREINGEVAKDPSLSKLHFSHTYVAVTDEQGKVTETFSWGNDGVSWHRNVPNDLIAAKHAVEKSWIYDLSQFVSDESVREAYWNKAKEKPHANYWIVNNCKFETDSLVNLARMIQERNALIENLQKQHICRTGTGRK